MDVGGFQWPTTRFTAPTYELFTRALARKQRERSRRGARSPTCGPTQDTNIAGAVRLATYERLAAEVANPRIRWAYLPYAIGHGGPAKRLQHMIHPQELLACTHFIIRPRHGGCKSSGLAVNDFYGPYQAPRALSRARETGAWKRSLPQSRLYEEEGYRDSNCVDLSRNASNRRATGDCSRNSESMTHISQTITDTRWLSRGSGEDYHVVSLCRLDRE